MQITGYASKGFYGTPATQAYANVGAGGSAKPGAAGNGGSAATVITLSQAALEASAEPHFSAVTDAAREMLNRLLSETERTSPLQDGKLALDMSVLSARHLHAILKSEDGLFTGDERKAAELEMNRRFDLALSGPAAVSEVTGDYRTLYKAAATYLDGLSAEQKAEPQWQAARAAIDKALTALEADRGKLPQAIADDPVAGWLAKRPTDDGEADQPSDSLAQNLRRTLDKRYESGEAARGKLDLAAFDSRAVSAMALNRDGLFSAEEVRSANAEIRSRANSALSEGYKDAARSGDPTAFSRNIIAIYSSMSADERQAAGFSENLLSTAIASYESSSRLMDIMAAGMNAMGGMQNWFAR